MVPVILRTTRGGSPKSICSTPLRAAAADCGRRQRPRLQFDCGRLQRPARPRLQPGAAASPSPASKNKGSRPGEDTPRWAREMGGLKQVRRGRCFVLKYWMPRKLIVLIFERIFRFRQFAKESFRKPTMSMNLIFCAMLRLFFVPLFNFLPPFSQKVLKNRVQPGNPKKHVQRLVNLSPTWFNH